MGLMDNAQTEASLFWCRRKKHASQTTHRMRNDIFLMQNEAFSTHPGSDECDLDKGRMHVS